MPVDLDDPIFGRPLEYVALPVLPTGFKPVFSPLLPGGRSVWIDPVIKPSKTPRRTVDTGLEQDYTGDVYFEPSRPVYPSVSPKIPAPRPVASPIGSLTSPILYNNVNYANQPKLKPISN